MRTKTDGFGGLLLCGAVIAAVLVAASLCGVAGAFERTYTWDGDFDEGVLVGVEHDTAHNQLQLTAGPGVVPFPFIWVPNNEGTVSKVSTETGDELGRYWVAPFSWSSPSRTTVDLDGNCYVGCRQAGTVVKIGLYEANQWIDRNANGICDTCQDLNHDGNISPDEMLPWGQDECVLYEVVLVPGHEGTYAPGTYPGPYDEDYWGVAPRGLAVDANNNLWAGTWSTQKYYYINGATGEIMRVVDVSPWGAYGAALDANGVLWSSSDGGGHVLRLDPSTDPPSISTINFGRWVYGLGLDYLGHLFVSHFGAGISRVDVQTGLIDWIQDKPETGGARGVTCTADNDVWVANSETTTVTRYDNDGNLKATVNELWGGPSGVAVDAAGKVWACDLGDEYIHRIDPATNMIDLSKQIIGSGGHYTYSDMTGIVAREVGGRAGTWTVVYDSGVYDAYWWGVVSWTSDEPEGTSITVAARTSNDQLTWSGWQAVANGQPLATALRGQYVQIQARLRIWSGEVSPVLYDLTVNDYTGRVLDVGDGKAGPGRVGTAPVVLTEASGVAGLQFDVTYCLGRPGLLGFVEARKGPGLPADWVFEYSALPDNKVRIITYSPTATPLPPGSAIVAELDFTVDPAATVGEHCALHPHDIILSDEWGLPIEPIAGADGTFTVIPPVHHFHVTVIPAPPEPQGGDLVVPEENSRPLPFVVRAEARDEYDAPVASYNGTATLTANVGTADPGSLAFSGGVWEGPVVIYADLDPDCTLTVEDLDIPASGTSEVFSLRGKGDVDGSGAVNVLDVIRVVRIALEIGVPGFPRYEFQFWAADMNRDGVVNVFDVIQVVNKSLGQTAALGAAAMGAIAPSAGPVEVTVAPARGGAWAIRVSNAAGLAGAQLEIACKEGKVAAGELAAAAGWQAQSNWVNGRLRVLAYSPSATGLTASEGTLLLLSNTRGRPRVESVLLSDAAGRTREEQEQYGNRR